MSDAAVRAFLAVPPDGGWSESARHLLAELRRDLPEASWTRPETWHVTLRFLGDVPPETLAGISQSVAESAAGLGPASLVARGPAVFPPRGPARVVGISLEGEGSIEDLAAVAETCARRAGLAAEPRPFHPHVTFARIRRPWPREAVARFREAADSWKLPAWPVRSFALYRSELRPEGAIHTAIARWELPAREGVIA